MDPTTEARLRARECHDHALARAGGGRSAPALTAAGAIARGRVVAGFESGPCPAPEVDGHRDHAGSLFHESPPLPDPEGAMSPYAGVIAGIAVGRFPARPGAGCPSAPRRSACCG